MSKYDIVNCSISDTDIVKSIKPNSYFIVKDKLMYTGKSKVEITDEALITANLLADRYISDRCLPDKAIDLIDEAAAELKMDVIFHKISHND